VRALRSLLNTPASRPKMLERAATSGADALVFDLEDSVPQDQKAEARAVAAEYLQRLGAEHVIYVRVNALETGVTELDLDAVVGPGLAGIQLPKADSVDDVARVDGMLSGLEAARGLAPGSVEVVASLETARGVWSAFDIASCPRVGSVMIGTAQDGDLQRDVGYQHSGTGEEILYLRARVLLAARAAGIHNPLDGVYPNFRDTKGLIADAGRARALGFRGKKAIHPDQVEAINLIFTPDQREVEHYAKILAAFEEALGQGSASTSVDGQMIDVAMAETARRVLAWAKELGR